MSHISMPQEGNVYFGSGSGEFCCFSPEKSGSDFSCLEAAYKIGLSCCIAIPVTVIIAPIMVISCALGVAGLIITAIMTIALWALGFSGDSIATAVTIPLAMMMTGFALPVTVCALFGMKQSVSLDFLTSLDHPSHVKNELL